MAHTEFEETLVFPDSNIEDVLDIVWPASGLIDAGDVMLRLSAVRMKRQAHLYVAPEAADRRTRIKVRVDRQGLSFRRQEKALGDYHKDTVSDTGWITGPDVYRRPETWDDITAAFVKERISLRYQCKGRSKVDIAIDRLTPLHLGTLERLPHTVWYLEIEGAEWVPPVREVPIGAAFWSRLTSVASVADYGQAKWEVARANSEQHQAARSERTDSRWIDAVAQALVAGDPVPTAGGNRSAAR